MLRIATGRHERRIAGRRRPADHARRPSAGCATASGSPSGATTWRRPATAASATCTCPTCRPASLAQLYVDLDADNIARDGVVIDVRNNNGGFVNVYALDVLSRQPYLNMTQRGTPTAPARSALGQRSLEKPTVLVTNQHSLSDAEDFTEGYRAMKLGKVVGEPTAGWIIFTWNTRLMDGTVLRLPRSRITDRNGAPMEMHPRPVDVEVKRPIGESYGPRDAQLDKAVEVLLAQLQTELVLVVPSSSASVVDLVRDPCASRCCRGRARPRPSARQSSSCVVETGRPDAP